MEQLSLLPELERTCQRLFGCQLAEATELQVYKSLCVSLRELLMDRQRRFQRSALSRGGKQVYYMSMEFLVGTSLRNNLFNLGLLDETRRLLAERGFDLDEICEMEPDAGLGNGGLGRLAACYMDALSGLDCCAVGCSIRYEFGIFRQKIVDGWQMEFPDNWLERGDVWLLPRQDDAVEVRFGGEVREWMENGRFRTEQIGYSSVMAIPYDLYISGYGTKAVNKLILWSAKVPSSFDMAAFSRGDYMQALEQNTMAETISKVLYPADNHIQGKRLRLKQQYLLVCASLQGILRDHLKHNASLDSLPDKVAVHINDTHPALCVPELMRLLMDEYGYGWDDAWSITRRTLTYTNHTVMPEALECWSEDLFREQLPRIYAIVREIDRRLRNELGQHYPGDWGKIDYMAVLSQGQVHMANLCLTGCHKINGVSRLHTEILENGIFRDYYRMDPDRFTNVTNGIAYRRWLCQANPPLTAFLTELIGPDFIRDAGALEGLLLYRDDPAVLERLRHIKLENKRALAAYVEKAQGVRLDPSCLFDVQIKRLHEYKRQLLNILHVLHLYRSLKDAPNRDFVPRAYLFAAKASAGYTQAKQIISLIVAAADQINRDPAVRDKLRVVFLEDYKVSLAERIIPAAEISEQISLAGKEASGTGNMKLMLNGAVTLGTLDGANVEICQQVGQENMFLFGLHADQVEALWREGYDPAAYLTPELRQTLQMLVDGSLGRRFQDLYDSLLTRRFGIADAYMIAADFPDYARAQALAARTWQDSDRFARMSLVNIAKSGLFSADRAVREYALNIWNLPRI